MKASAMRFGICAATMLTGSNWVRAAEPAASQSVADGQLNEVIVTAQRREERMMTVPVAESVFSPRDLDVAQVTSIRSLAALAPSLTVTSSVENGAGDILIGMRGLSLTSILPNVDSTVGVNVDGVYYARTVGADIAMTDMERVEVLRGPQGTLFGRNTIGGALNVTTQKPTQNLEGVVTVDYGNYNMVAANGVFNIPLIADKLAVRFVVDHQQHSGYGHDDYLGTDLADQKTDYVRGSVRFTPQADITFDLIGDYLHTHANSSNWVVSYFNPDAAGRAPSVPPALGNYLQDQGRDNSAGVNPKTDGYVYNLNGTLLVDMGLAKAKSITSYRNFSINDGADLDGTPFQLGDLAITRDSADQFTQELQLYGSALADKFKWIGGLYYFGEHVSDWRYVESTAFGGSLIETSLPKVLNTSKSAYTQLSYEILPAVRLTAGARYVVDDREINYQDIRRSLSTGAVIPGAAGCGFPIGLSDPPQSCTYSPEGADYRYVPWTAGLDYRLTPDALLYFKVSKGFRSGAFQQIPIINGDTGQPFGPVDTENVLSYELGTKLSLFDNRLRLTAAAYTSEYNAIQQSVPFYATGTTVAVLRLLNAGTARISGGELDAAALLGKLRLEAGLGLVFPKFTSGPYENSNFITAPKTTASLRAGYPVDTTYGLLTLSGDYVYQSAEFFFTNLNLNTNPATYYSEGAVNSVTQTGYGLVNAQGTFKITGTGFTVGLWAKNIADKYYVLRDQSFYSQGYNTSVPGIPRTFGVSASYAF
jgi:iron complex outermembrane recepter protein